MYPTGTRKECAMPPQQTQAVMLASIMGKACQFDIRCIAKISLPKGDVYLSGWIEKPGLSEKRGSSFLKLDPLSQWRAIRA
jgi:hypothetical protein